MKTIKDLQETLKNIEEKKSNEQFFSDITIKDILDSHVEYEEEGSSGWMRVYCKVCGDGSRTKGPRGGWKVEGENCYYHCFNCGISGAFTPTEEIFMSKTMKDIFRAYGITSKEYGKVLYRLRSQLNSQSGEQKNNFDKLTKNNTSSLIDKMIQNSMPFPDYLIPLSKVIDTDIGKLCLNLLESKCLSYQDYEFYISSGKTNSKAPQEKINAKITMNRLVIPIWYGSNLLMLQARALDDNSKKKYINIGSVSTTLYGLDRLSPDHKQIYVVEGFFDAFHLDGVATISNKLHSFQLDILNSIDKPKVVVPDRNDDSHMLLAQAVNAGWGLSYPDSLRSCKDVTEAVKKYGKIFTCYNIQQASVFGEKARFFMKAIV